MSQTAWHTLSAEQTAEQLRTAIVGGLAHEEAQARLKQHGLNEPPRQRDFYVFRAILAQVKSPLALVLLATGVGAMFLGAAVDALVIIAALFINISIGVVQEGRASRIYEALEKSHAQTATVERDGKKRVIPAQYVVPGDIVHIAGGKMVPADLRFVSGTQVEVNEAPLTGEWKPVTKQPSALPEKTPIAERKGMLWSGTTVTAGFGMGIAVATGASTQLGHLARAAQRIYTHRTPLQIGVSKLAHTIIYILAIVITITAILGLLQGRPFFEIALISIAVAVAAMPEGLPAAVSVVLVVGMKEILARGGLVRSLVATETLGSTTVILTDKTGTLTEGEMSVARFYTCKTLSEGNTDIDLPDNRAVLEMAILASDAFIDTSGGKRIPRGRPIERALVTAGMEHGLIQDELFRHQHGRCVFLQFEALRRYAASVNEDPRDGFRVYLTGSPEHLVKASSMCAIAGGARELNADLRAAFINHQDEQSALGHALIGVAYRKADKPEIPEDVLEGGPELRGLVFAGLIVLADKLRPGVREEIAVARAAGVRVVMVTGDHAETARAIAVETGIANADDDVITGAELAEMDEKGIGEVVMREHVFARVTPEEKLRIVHALTDLGQVVAMTGDGVNDAPALSAAAVGVALESGTDVAKEASDIILLKNSFSTITAAIHEGRRIVANLGKVVAYLLSTGVSEVLLIVGALIAGVPLPLLPTQLLWTNIIHEGFMSTPFAFEPADTNLMKQKPRGAQERVLTPLLIRFVVIVSVLGAALFLGFYILLYSLDTPIDHLRTLVFSALSLSALAMALSFKDPERPIWRIAIGSNKALLYSLGASLTIFILSLILPFTRSLLSLTALGPTDVLILLAFAVANIIVVEFSKWLARKI